MNWGCSVYDINQSEVPRMCQRDYYLLILNDFEWRHFVFPTFTNEWIEKKKKLFLEMKLNDSWIKSQLISIFKSTILLDVVTVLYDAYGRRTLINIVGKHGRHLIQSMSLLYSKWDVMTRLSFFFFISLVSSLCCLIRSK